MWSYQAACRPRPSLLSVNFCFAWGTLLITGDTSDLEANRTTNLIVRMRAVACVYPHCVVTKDHLAWDESDVIGSKQSKSSKIMAAATPDVSQLQFAAPGQSLLGKNRSWEKGSWRISKWRRKPTGPFLSTLQNICFIIKDWLHSALHSYNAYLGSSHVPTPPNNVLCRSKLVTIDVVVIKPARERSHPGAQA